MSRSFVQAGDVMTFTSPSGGVTAGTGVLIGNLLVIPTETVAAGLQFDGYVSGVHSHAKANSQAWTEGANLYWDDTNKVFTTSSATGANSLRGVAAAAVANTAGLVTGLVRLNGVGV